MKQNETDNTERQSNLYYIGAFLLGFFAIYIQTALFRELSVFLGSNELLIAIFLLFWLFSAGLGSLVFRRVAFTGALMLFVAFSVISIATFRIISIWILPDAGMIVPAPSVIVICLIAIVPVAFFDGSVFSSFSLLAKVPRKIYALEGLGAFFGGLLSLLAIGVFDITISASIIGIAIFCYLAFRQNKLYLLILPILVAGAIYIPLGQAKHFGRHFNNSTIIESRDARSGRIFVTELNGEKYLYLNSNLKGTMGDSLDAAMWLHSFMLANQDKDELLIFGGAISGVVNQASMYDLSKLTYYEPDPGVIDAYERHFPGRLEGAMTKSGNFRRAVDSHSAIVYAPSIPDDLSGNTFYSYETIENIHDNLGDDGVLCIFLNAGENFLTPREIELTGSVWRTVDDVFAFSEAFFIAGKAMVIGYVQKPEILHTERLSLAEAPGELYFPKSVIELEFNLFRQEGFYSQIGDLGSYPLNYDLRPVAYYYGFTQFAQLSGISIPRIFNRREIAPIALLILFVLVLIDRFLFKRRGFAFRAGFFGGFFGLGVQLIWILMFQLALGNVFWAFGLLSGIFLLGSSLAAWYGGSPKIKPAHIFAIMIAVILIGFISINLLSKSLFPHLSILLIMSSGISVGLLYSSLLRIKTFAKTPGLLYSTDLLGASVSAFLPALILAPLYGIPLTLVIFAIALLSVFI